MFLFEDDVPLEVEISFPRHPWMDPRDPRTLPTPDPTHENGNAPNGEAKGKVAAAAAAAAAPAVVPPYWQQHQRHASYASVISNGKPPPISLEDHTEEPEEVSSPLWAKVVSIESHVLVSGNVPGLGDYVVWICRVETLDVSDSCLLCCLLHRQEISIVVSTDN